MINSKRILPDNLNVKFIPKMEKIILEYYNLDTDVFWKRPKFRKREYVWARQLLMYFQYTHMKMSLAGIGERYCKDHSTVLHAKKSVKNICEVDKKAYQDYENIYRMIHTVYKEFSDTDEYVCSKCGTSHGISVLLWVNPNKDMILEVTPENAPGICEKCGETVIVTKLEYQTQYA